MDQAPKLLDLISHNSAHFSPEENKGSLPGKYPLYSNFTDQVLT